MKIKLKKVIFGILFIIVLWSLYIYIVYQQQIATSSAVLTAAINQQNALQPVPMSNLKIGWLVTMAITRSLPGPFPYIAGVIDIGVGTFAPFTNIKSPSDIGPAIVLSLQGFGQGTLELIESPFVTSNNEGQDFTQSTIDSYNYLTTKQSYINLGNDFATGNIANVAIDGLINTNIGPINDIDAAIGIPTIPAVPNIPNPF